MAIFERKKREETNRTTQSAEQTAATKQRQKRGRNDTLSQADVQMAEMRQKAQALRQAGTTIQNGDTAGMESGITGAEDLRPGTKREPVSETLLTIGAGGKPAIGKAEINKAAEILTRYKQGKANLETRIVEDELWWELRHWEVIRRGKNREEISPDPTSAWLFNALINKHADAMDNYPEPLVLPREASDKESAKILSQVLPVLLEYNDYDQTYSDNWWEKLKHGTAAYGVFWNPEKENGLGDVDIRGIDLLKIFWEPGVTDLQKSRNLFLVDLVDEDLLEQQYPQHKGKLGGNVIDVKQYIYDDTVDTQGKSLVVDWYYKVRSASGRTVLHYAKFVGDTLLFASENEELYRERGWYDHGFYPVVFDVLFPEKGTPAGFGYVSICKDPQIYIDRLSGNILENSMMATKKRFFASSSTNINEEEFLDWSRPIVHVEGELDDRRLKEFDVQPLSAVYLNVVQMKIEELKETAANRDVSSGGATSGVTAASAIAALQEAGNKVSRDMISATYRANTAISVMCIELIRQFYDETRSFRITGVVPGGEPQFVGLNNRQLQDQQLPPMYPGQEKEPGYIPIFRRPVFDIKISAQKKNPFSRMEQNERAKELYQMGFFNPERAQEAMGALDMMDFEGIDQVREKVQEGQTLLHICQQMSQQMDQMALLLQTLTGRQMGTGADHEQSTAKQTPVASGSASLADRTMQAQEAAMTPYGQRLARRSVPSMDGGSDAARPQV